MIRRSVAVILACLTILSIKSQSGHKAILDTVNSEKIITVANSTAQDPEIPLVFAQWWFWIGLILILVFIKYVVFKK